MKKMAISSAWSVGAAAFNNISTLIVFVALARLLTPEQFGIVAFATVFVEFSRALVQAGFPDALIQQADWDDEVATSAFWVNLLIGFAFCLIAVVCVPLLSYYYDRTFALVLVSLSTLLIIEGATAVHVAKLRREFQHKVIARRSVAANIVSGVLGVSLAFAGWGVWAMVVSRLLAALGTSIILWSSAQFRPGRRMSLDHVRMLSGFAKNLLAAQMLNQVASQVPAFLIGGMLGPAAIAQFRVGTRSLQLLTSLAISPIQSASISVLARQAHDPNAIVRSYLRLTRSTALIACPVLLGLAAVAPDLVSVVFGPQWVPAGYVLIVMCLSAGAMSLGFFEAPTLIASGRSDLTFKTSLAGAIGDVIMSSIAIAAGTGPIGVAVAMSLRGHLTMPYALGLIKQAIGVPRRVAVIGLLPAYLGAAAMAGVVTLLRVFLLADVDPLLRLLISIVVGALVYPFVMLVCAPSFLRNNIADVAPLLPEWVKRPLNKLGLYGPIG